MSLFDFLRNRKNAENAAQTTTPSEETAPPVAETLPPPRKSLLEIAREAEEQERLAREREQAEAEAQELPDEAGDEEADEEIESRVMDFYKIHLEKVDLAGKPDLMESRLGGVPYWDNALPYPTDENGNPMVLLLQLNFDALSLDDARLPQTGLLQFFISQDPLCAGKVIYHREINTDAQPDNLPFMPLADGFSPVKAQARVFLQRDFIEDTEDGHKIFGTPAFCQGDPREYLPAEQMNFYDTLLLQIDSDYNGGDPIVIWGDSGVGNFFINADDLKNCQFDNVLFYWDCY